MKELLIKNEQDKNKFFVVEDGSLVEYYEEALDNQTLEGNIYIGKVQNVITGLEAAFVNLGEGKNAFIHKKDILPKIDETSENTETDERNLPIKKLIKPGMPILVEIKKDRMQTKGARVSTHISLRGRFIVLMPNSPYVTVSSKIEKTEKIEQIKNLVKEKLPDGMGAIIRTNAKNVTLEEIERDIEKQLEIWEKIKNVKAENIPQKVYDSGGMMKKLLIDLADSSLDKITVNTKELAEKLEAILEEIGVKLKLEVVKDEIENKYDIKKVISKINSKKIWLKSGGFITIDDTEALTAIDVNSGKFTRKR